MAPHRTAQRKAETFASSPMSDIDVDFDSDSYDGQSRPIIPAQKVSTPVKKRMKLEKGIDISNVIRTPARGSTSSEFSVSDDDNPSAKRQRVTRHQKHNSLNYDTRLHPLDKYTRPAHFTKVNEEYCSAKQHAKHSDSSDGDIDANNVGKDDGASQTSQEAISDTERTPVKTSHTAKRTSTPRLPSPNRRRSSRTLGRNEAPNYNMKIHPDYDRIHRPAMIKAASRKISEELESRQASAKSSTTSTLVSEDSMAQSFSVGGSHGLYRDAAATNLTFSEVQAIAIPPLPKSKTGKSPEPAKGKPRPESPPGVGKVPSTAPPAEAPGVLQPLPDMRKTPSKSSSSSEGYSSNPRGRAALDFNDLSSLDSRLYRLQNGAPAQGNTLPNSWDYVKQILFDNGEISLDALHSDEGTKWIKARYEEVRLGIGAFWTSKPDPTEDRDLTLRHMETFSVFDQKRGSKYWRHYEDSLYRPISTGRKEIGQVAETDDHEETYHESNEPYGLWLHRAMDRGTSPWIVGADEVTSGASSPFHASAEEDFSPNFEDGNREQSYIDLGDGGEEQGDVDHDRTLVESMRDAVQSSDPVISTQELTKLLSPVTEYVFHHRGSGDATSSVKDINVLSDPAAFELNGLRAEDDDPASLKSASLRTNVRERGASKSSPTPLEAFRYVKKTSVSTVDQTDSSQHTDDLQTSRVAGLGQKRKSRNEQEVIIREDSPDRQAVAQNFKSPRTDLPKENLEGGEAAEYSGDIHVRTPTIRRHREAVSTPPIARVAPGGNAKTTPSHLSFFGGPMGPVSPLA